MWLILACHSENQDSPLSKESDSSWIVGDSVFCEAPDKGIALVEVGQTLGLTEPTSDPTQPFGTGTVVVEDINGDETLELIYMDEVHGVTAYTYQDGQFESLGAIMPENTGAPFSLIEMTGDPYPDLVVSGGNIMMVAENTGEAPWMSRKTILQTDEPTNFVNPVFGDFDRDHDLDIVLPSGGVAPGDQGFAARTLRNDDGEFVFWQWLPQNQSPLNVQAALVTDIDQDLDLDIYLANDLETISTLWINEGGAFSEQAQAYGLALDQAGMGVDSTDLNGDGVLDYCFSNVGPMNCMLSSPDNVFYEAAKALRLVPEQPTGVWDTIGWSVELVDLDNDGDVDAAQASGEQGVLSEESREGPVYRDLLWENQNGVFLDITEETNFGDLYNHVGMVAADFNRDGMLELVFGNPAMRPLLYQQSCNENAWINIDLMGPPGNRQGLGSRVVVKAGAATYVRELHGLRSHGQGPSEFHIGLGKMKLIDQITIQWPDGEVSELTEVTPNRRLVAIHPLAEI